MSDDESICDSAALGPASNDVDVPSPMLILAGDLHRAPVAPTEGRRKRKRAGVGLGESRRLRRYWLMIHKVMRKKRLTSCILSATF